MQLKTSKGFTLVEVLMVMVISLTIMGLAAVSLLRTKQITDINNSVGQIISDINSQQLKAMVGATDGVLDSTPYGIFFTQGSYILFRGTSYSSTDSANTVISLEENINISNISFPSSTIVFSRQSGEVIGFNPSNNNLTINDITSDEQRTITINRYGVVTSITQ